MVRQTTSSPSRSSPTSGRESRAGIAKALATISVTVEQAELSSGDYLIGGGCAVERKAAVDFVASLMENRLFEQMAKMSVEHERTVILVEEDIYETQRHRAHPTALDGALSYISLLSSASLIFSPSIERTPHLLYRMATHTCNMVSAISLGLRSNKPKGSPLARYILEVTYGRLQRRKASLTTSVRRAGYLRPAGKNCFSSGARRRAYPPTRFLPQSPDSAETNEGTP